MPAIILLLLFWIVKLILHNNHTECTLFLIIIFISSHIIQQRVRIPILLKNDDDTEYRLLNNWQRYSLQTFIFLLVIFGRKKWTKTKYSFHHTHNTWVHPRNALIYLYKSILKKNRQVTFKSHCCEFIESRPPSILHVNLLVCVV